MSIITKSLEKIPSKALEEFSFLLNDLIGKEQGIYALYRGDILYYTGKSIDLQRRLIQHLDDRHKKKWDSFSLFVVKDKRHIADLESLLIKIHKPKGNTLKPKIKAKNLLKDYKNLIVNFHKEELEKMLGEENFCKNSHKNKKIISIIANYKGTQYNAKYNYSDHSVCYNKKTYSSPSAAGRAVTGKPNDGLLFWKIKNKKGQLTPLKKVI